MSEARFATARVNDEIIDRADVQSRVGTFPQISYTSHPGEDRGQAKFINAAEFISALAADQENAYSGTPDPVTLVMVDGKSAGDSYPALITSPSYSTGIGYTGRKKNGVHEAAILIGLRTDIYTGAKDEWRTDNNPGSASVATRLKELTEFIIKEWEDNGGDASEISEETKQAIHTQNEPRLSIWYKILEDSVDTTEIEALGALKDENPAVNAGVNSWMVSLLRSSKQNFMGVVQAFCSAFHMVYEPPSPDYSSGRLVKIVDLLEEDPEELSVMVVDEDLTAGPVRTLPLKKVIITGVSTTEYRDNGDMKDGRNVIGASNIAEYPPGEFTGGSIQSFGKPPYLPDAVRPTAAGLDANAGLTSSNYQQSVTNLRDGVNGYITDSVIALCEYHAKGLYANLALSNSQASLNTELDLRWRAGRRYKVTATSKEGEDIIFTGILMSVTHSLSSNQDSPHASSNLNFAYVEAEGFTFELP